MLSLMSCWITIITIMTVIITTINIITIITIITINITTHMIITIIATCNSPKDFLVSLAKFKLKLFAKIRSWSRWRCRCRCRSFCYVDCAEV